MIRLSSIFWSCCLVVLAASGADAPSRCGVCQSLINGNFFWWQNPALTNRIAVCEPCSHLENTCFLCKLPIRHRGRCLDDGRWICEADDSRAVFSAPEALRIYEETWRDLQELLAGSGILPRQDIVVSLVDGRELRKLNSAAPSEHADGTLLGLTRTRTFANKEFQHRIYVITGLGRARLAAVCAHEYAHIWLQENVPANRTLDHDTVEGFCELVAYQLMNLRQEELEKRVILANAYTRGQVNAFVQAQAQHQFHRIVTWMKTGLDGFLPASTNAVPVLALREEPSVPLWPPPAPTPTPVPDTLLLKGISGQPSRRFVLINDCTLAPNEEGRVRVGSSNLLIRCLAIRERSVVIRVHGERAFTELFLGAN